MTSAKSPILAIAEDIAAELGPQYVASSEYEHAATITDGTVGIFLRWDDGGRKDRIKATPSYRHVLGTERAWDLTRYDEKDYDPSTTFAATRDPKAIANQISRTVKPAAEKWAPIFAERLAARGDAQAKRAAAFAEIQSMFPGAHSRTEEYDGNLGLYPSGPWHGHVNLYHEADRATVELHGLPWDVVVKILRLAAEVK